MHVSKSPRLQRPADFGVDPTYDPNTEESLLGALLKKCHVFNIITRNRAIYRVILQRTVLYDGCMNRVKGGRILILLILYGESCKIGFRAAAYGRYISDSYYRDVVRR